MTTHCPCCNAPVGAASLDVAVGAVTPLMGEIVTLLAKGRPLRSARLADLVYADRVDGGPLGGANVIQVTISQNRQRLAKAGWRVEHTPGGYALRVARRTSDAAVKQ